MKKIFLTAVFFLISTACFASVNDFLGVPVMPGGTIINQTDDQLEVTTDMTHDQVLAFYRETLEGQPDINYRDWKVATYIEDDGKQGWHSITILKKGSEGTSVTIARDSWTWIIGTLVLRYIGVFVVLLILFLGMSISGKIISMSLAKAQAK
ncbi:MAG: hypothetical protein JW944_04385 [Deltaproteobacteria bacterium]|nr:hypothetical protein [Deltaproteobacteria bacterium]